MKHLLISAMLAVSFGVIQGCSILREFPRRSEVTVKVQASNPVSDKRGARSTEASLTLRGNNRDILAGYKDAFEFTLEKLGLIRK